MKFFLESKRTFESTGDFRLIKWDYDGHFYDFNDAGVITFSAGFASTPIYVIGSPIIASFSPQSTTTTTTVTTVPEWSRKRDTVYLPFENVMFDTLEELIDHFVAKFPNLAKVLI